MVDGARILDVGCGFGGTIDHLDERLDGCELVGLNIDRRQLARARALVTPRRDNTVDFVAGDACRLPFADASFDFLSAVECAFHFPSRKQFFREAGTGAASRRRAGHVGLHPRPGRPGRRRPRWGATTAPRPTSTVTTPRR